MIKNSISFILLVLTVILVQGCAAPAMKSEPIKFHKDHSEIGLIVGSISFPESKARFNGYFPLIKSLDPDEKISKKNTTEIAFKPSQITRLKHDGELEQGKTYLFVLERNPGKYEVSRVRYASIGFGGAVRDAISSKFSIPFEVKKGEITYVGEIKLNEYADENDTLIKVDDNFERDIRMVKLKQPSVDWSKAKKSELQIIYK